MPQPPIRRIGLLTAVLVIGVNAPAIGQGGREFSTDRQNSGVRGFDSPRRTSETDAKSGVSEKNREWARSVMDRQDEDRNGYLSPSEVRRWERMKRFDHDSNQRISLEELAAYSSGTPLPAKKRRAITTTPEDKDGRRSQRLWTATDKLPEGLPGWFSDKDKNRDGQVAMHEYSSRWDSRTLRRFADLDSDDDGLITPAEALAKN